MFFIFGLMCFGGLIFKEFNFVNLIMNNFNEFNKVILL